MILNSSNNTSRNEPHSLRRRRSSLTAGAPVNGISSYLGKDEGRDSVCSSYEQPQQKQSLTNSNHNQAFDLSVVLEEATHEGSSLDDQMKRISSKMTDLRRKQFQEGKNSDSSLPSLVGSMTSTMNSSSSSLFSSFSSLTGSSSSSLLGKNGNKRGSTMNDSWSQASSSQHKKKNRNLARFLKKKKSSWGLSSSATSSSSLNEEGKKTHNGGDPFSLGPLVAPSSNSSSTNTPTVQTPPPLGLRTRSSTEELLIKQHREAAARSSSSRRNQTFTNHTNRGYPHQEEDDEERSTCTSSSSMLEELQKHQHAQFHAAHEAQDTEAHALTPQISNKTTTTKKHRRKPRRNSLNLNNTVAVEDAAEEVVRASAHQHRVVHVRIQPGCRVHEYSLREDYVDVVRDVQADYREERLQDYQQYYTSAAAASDALTAQEEDELCQAYDDYLHDCWYTEHEITTFRRKAERHHHRTRLAARQQAQQEQAAQAQEPAAPHIHEDAAVAASPSSTKETEHGSTTALTFTTGGGVLDHPDATATKPLNYYRLLPWLLALVYLLIVVYTFARDSTVPCVFTTPML